MPKLTLVTQIAAPTERCFDLARSIDLHIASTAATGERAIAGVTHGLIGLGDDVTWRARHLGIWQTLTTRITAFERPAYFRDSMVHGAFRRFDHDHYFERHADATRMTDVFDYDSPFGLLGRLADAMFLEQYMRRFLAERNDVIKQAAEGTAWRELVPG